MGGPHFFTLFRQTCACGARNFKYAAVVLGSVKNILVGPDGSDGSSEPSGPTRILFIGCAREGAGLLTHRESFPMAQKSHFGGNGQKPENTVFAFFPKSDKVLPLMYIRCVLENAEDRPGPLLKPPKLTHGA